MNRHLAVRLRLYEIDRRSAELSAKGLELADMASELDRLRKLNDMLSLLTKHGSTSNSKRYNSLTCKRLRIN